MILHNASSGTVARGVFLFLWPHCHPGDIVILLCVDASAPKFCPAYTSSCWKRSLKYGAVSICGLGEFGVVSWGESSLYLFAAPCRWLPARTPSTVDVFLITVHMGTTVTSMVKPCFFFQAHLCTTVQLLCLMDSSFGLRDDSPPAYSHSSKYVLFKVSPVGIQNTCSNAFCGAVLPFRVSKSAGVAPLPPCFRKLLDETVKIFAVFPSWSHLLDGENNCMLSFAILHKRPSLEQLAKLRNLPGVVHWPSRCFTTCSGFP